MAYTKLSNTTPTSAQTGPAALASTYANLMAARDMAIGGGIIDWVYSQTGATEEPTVMVFTNGSLKYRITPTWGSGIEAGFITAALLELDDGTGGGYATIGTITPTYDGNQSIVASTGGSGFMMWMWQWFGKFKQLRTAYNAHVVSSAVHGLLSMAFQAASSVAITGGTAILSALKTDRIRGKQVSSLTVSGAYALDFNNSSYALVLTGNTTFTLANLPTSLECSSLTLEIFNPTAYTVTWPSGGTVLWHQGTPVQPGAHDIFVIWSRDGTTTVFGRTFSGIA